MAVAAKDILGRLLVAGMAIFLLTAQTVTPTPMPGDATSVGDTDMTPNGLVCSDGMETNPYNDDFLVIETADTACQVPQTPVHT